MTQFEAKTPSNSTIETMGARHFRFRTFILFYTTIFSCLLTLVTSWVTLSQKFPKQFSLLATKQLTAVGLAGVSGNEVKSVKQAVLTACQDYEVDVCWKDLIIWETPLETYIYGATGRVLLLQACNDETKALEEDVSFAISQELDQLIYNNPPLLSQPIMISIQTDIYRDEASIRKALVSAIASQVTEYEMAVPLCYNPKISTQCIPSIHVEVDGAYIQDLNGKSVWDTSTILVFDDFVSKDLLRRLRNVVLGIVDDDDEGSSAWNDMKQGPDPRRWTRGGLVDIPDNKDDETEGRCWGLTPQEISQLCFHHHDALQEFETLLASTFPQFTLMRLPEAVLGESVSPLTANAATFGDTFDQHIDADPALTPPSPWTDVYGRYPNRCKGKPRFMSCLVYMNEKWNCDDWGAPTRFWDVATDTAFDVQAIPGRVVLMDQDITHSVVAPFEAAGKRPRYSLVWKLILHPKQHGQDMTNLCYCTIEQQWPRPLLIGSANAGNEQTTC